MKRQMGYREALFSRNETPFLKMAVNVVAVSERFRETRPLRTAAEQRESPRRELEGQMEVLGHFLDSKSEYRNFQK